MWVSLNWIFNNHSIFKCIFVQEIIRYFKQNFMFLLSIRNKIVNKKQLAPALKGLVIYWEKTDEKAITMHCDT